MKRSQDHGLFSETMVLWSFHFSFSLIVFFGLFVQYNPISFVFHLIKRMTQCLLICFIWWAVQFHLCTLLLQVSRLHTSCYICWMPLLFIVQHCMCTGCTFVVLLDQSGYCDSHFLFIGIFIINYAEAYLECNYGIFIDVFFISRGTLFFLYHFRFRSKPFFNHWNTNHWGNTFTLSISSYFLFFHLNK